MTATILTTRKLPELTLAAPSVSVSGYFYAVDLGAGVRPQHHRVGLDARCTCSLGLTCPAVAHVHRYLAAGGEPPPPPPFGYYPVVPALCPVCGAGTAFEPSLSSPHRGAGWCCQVGGLSHYWQQRASLTGARRRASEQEV